MSGSSNNDGSFPRGGAPVVASAVPRPKSASATSGQGLFATQTPVHNKRKGSKSDHTGVKKKRGRDETGTEGEQDGGLDSKWVVANRSQLTKTLTFKDLRTGMCLLGSVSKVHSTVLHLSLPFALTAKCSLAEAVDTEKYDFQESKLPFQQGDILPCAVVSLEKNEERSVVWVSLRPKLVNSGLSVDQIMDGEILYGWVSSAEDHGYTIETGIDGVRTFLPYTDNDGSNGQGTPLTIGGPIWCTVKSVKLEKSGERTLDRGLFTLESYSQDFEGGSGVDKLSKKKADTVNTKLKGNSIAARLSGGLGYRLAGLKPGYLVKGEICQIAKTGLIVSLLGFYQGFIGMQHLPFPADAVWKKQYAKGQKIYARIISVDTVEKHIILSAVPSVVRMHAPNFSYEIGDIIDDGRVLRVDPKVGVLVSADKQHSEESMEAYKVPWNKVAFIHVSKLSDKRIDNIERLYQPGSDIKCRVTAYSWMDGIVLASSQKSVLNSPIFSYDDIQPGMLLKGMPTGDLDSGVVLTVGSKIKGFVPNMHILDNVTDEKSHTLKKYKEKMIDKEEYVSARVLSVDKTKRRLILTTKPSMVDTSLPVITSYAQAADILTASEKKGAADNSNVAVVNGVVDKVIDAGIVVAFFGGVKGLVHQSELEAAGMEDYKKDFRRGEIIRVCILSVDPVRERIKLSTLLTQSEREKNSVNGSATTAQEPEEGIQRVQAVAAVDSSRRFHISPKAGDRIRKSSKAHQTSPLISEPYLVVLGNSKRISVLPMQHLSDHAYVSEKLFEKYVKDIEAGSDVVFENGLAIEQKKLSGTVYRAHQKCLAQGIKDIQLLTVKPCLLWSLGKEKQLVKCPRHFMELSQGDLVVGYVVSVTAFGVFIRSMNGCTGMVPRSSLMKQSESTLDYTIGQSLIAMVQSVDQSKGSYVLTLRSEKVCHKMRTLRESLLEIEDDGENAYNGVSFPSLFLFSALQGEDNFPDNVASSSKETEEDEQSEDSEDEDEEEEDEEEQEVSRILTHSRLPPGTVVQATVELLREYGVVCSASIENSTVPAFMHKSFCEDDVKTMAIGSSFEAEVLDVDVEKGIIDIAPSSSPSAIKGLKVGQEVECTIQLLRRKDQTLQYAIVRLSGKHTGLGIMALSEYCVTSDQASEILHTPLEQGTSLNAVVTHVPGSHRAHTLDTVLLNPFISGKKGSASSNDDLTSASNLRPGMRAMAVVLHGLKRKHGGVMPMQVKLVGVRGKYKCTVPLSEVLECDLTKFYDSPHKIDNKLLKKALSVKRGSEIAVKIVSVKLPTSSSEVKEVSIHATTKEADLAIQEERLEHFRPSWQPLYKDDNVVPEIFEPVPISSSQCTLSDGTQVGLKHDGPPLSDSPLYEEKGDIPCNTGLRRGVDLQPGSVVSGVVERVDTEGVMLGLGSGIRGKCHVTELGASAEEVEQALETLNVGDFVSAAVIRLNERSKQVELSYHLASSLRVKAESLAKELAEVKSKKSKKSSGSPKLQVSLNILCEKLDEYISSLNSFYPGKTIVCRVERLHSAVENLKESVQKLHGDSGEHAYLNQDTRLRVTFGPMVEKFGYVNATHSADPSEWKSFPFEDHEDDDVVDAVILNCPNEENPTDTPSISSLRNRFELSFRESVKKKSTKLHKACTAKDDVTSKFVKWLMKEENSLFQKMREEEKGKGFILNTSKKGCFVQLTLFHVARILVSNLSNSYVTNVAQEFPPAKLVAGNITMFDAKTNRIEMSLKDKSEETPSAPNLDWVKQGQVLDGIVDSVTEFGAFVRLIDPNSKNASGVKGLCHVSELSDKPLERSRLSIMEHINPSDTVCVYVLKVDQEKGKVALSMKPSLVQQSLQNRNKTKAATTGGKENEKPVTPTEMNVIDELNEIQDDDADIEMDKNVAQSERNNLWAAPEWTQNSKDTLDMGDIQSKLRFSGASDVHAEEKRRAAGEQNPASAADFEKLVAATPQDSNAWIRFIAWLISVTEIDQARKVAERALLSLRFNEKESKAIWVAYLNMEQRYGDDDRLRRIYERAVESNSPHAIRHAMAHILQQNGDIEGAAGVWKKIMSTEKDDKDTWSEYFEFLMRNGQEAEVHGKIDTALSHVPSKHHLWLLQRVAVLEFKYGNAEKGRTMMENIVSSYPKRPDVWNVYIDQELSSGNIDAARKLFERAVSSKWKPKKVKAMFKKWLQFEQNSGTTESVNHVKSLAQSYAESLMQ